MPLIFRDALLSLAAQVKKFDTDNKLAAFRSPRSNETISGDYITYMYEGRQYYVALDGGKTTNLVLHIEFFLFCNIFF